MAFSHSSYNSQINLSPKEPLEVSLGFSASVLADKLPLSSKELLAISDEISRDFAPAFSTPLAEPSAAIKFSPRELLDISQEISREFAPDATSDNTSLVLMPVDPDHVYAYWNLAEHKINTAQKYPPEEHPLALRFYSQHGEETTGPRTESWFEVAINSPKAQHKVLLPEPGNGLTYSASIGERSTDNTFNILASSAPIYTPRGTTAPHLETEHKTASDPTLATNTNGTEPVSYASKNASGQGKK